jgi:7-carboxy-7-deazaguanine synthase
MTGPSLRVFSIFSSIQGESTRQGRPCTFVRLAGCPLSCIYCDTRLACREPGEPMAVPEIVSLVSARGLGLVEVTGGEPLAQPATPRLLSALADAGFEVLLETSGALSIEGLDPRVRVVLDLKTPGSGMHDRMLAANYDCLDPDRCELKLVITGRQDFDWGLRFLRQRNCEGRVEVLFSPARGWVEAADLAHWLMESRFPGRLQIQLHRVLWPRAEEER